MNSNDDDLAALRPAAPAPGFATPTIHPPPGAEDAWHPADGTVRFVLRAQTQQELPHVFSLKPGRDATYRNQQDLANLIGMAIPGSMLDIFVPDSPFSNKSRFYRTCRVRLEERSFLDSALTADDIKNDGKQSDYGQRADTEDEGIEIGEVKAALIELVENGQLTLSDWREVDRAVSAELDSHDTTSETDVALGAISRLTISIKEDQASLDVAVETARHAGASWPQIGQAAKVAPQSAHQRWSEAGRKSMRERDQRRRGRVPRPEN